MPLPFSGEDDDYVIHGWIVADPAVLHDLPGHEPLHEIAARLLKHLGEEVLLDAHEPT
jgi:hypothetical protein